MTTTNPNTALRPELLALVHAYSSRRPLLAELPAHIDHRIEMISTLKQAFERLLETQPTGLILEIDHPGCQNIELLAAADAFHLNVPLFLLTDDAEGTKVPFEWTSRVQLIECRRELNKLAGILKSGLRSEREHSRLRVADYLQITILGKQSVTLELYGGHGKDLYIDVVGGDVWNAYGEDEVDLEILANFMDQIPNSVRIRPLERIPPERQFKNPGLELLEVIKRSNLTSTPEKPIAAPKTQALDLEMIQQTVTQHDELSTAELHLFSQNEIDRERSRQEQLDEFVTRGFAAALSRDYECALQQFAEAEKIDPNDPRVVHNLQQIRRRLKK